MALDGISTQTPSPTIPPVVSRPAPPPANAKQEELVAYAKAELSDRDVASFSSHDQELQELAANRQRETVGTTRFGEEHAQSMPLRPVKIPSVDQYV